MAVEADLGELARVHHESWHDTYAELFPEPIIRARTLGSFEERLGRTLRDPDDFTIVALVAGAMVGLATAGPCREGAPGYAGELHTLYLLPGHRGRGLGERMVREVAAELAGRGMGSMLLWVFSDNVRACRFYERLGAVEVAERSGTLDGRVLRDVCYGWPNTAPLLKSSLGVQ